ncbi:hypothetical protein FOZ63_021566, partial [Perkinsus olseni]
RSWKRVGAEMRVEKCGNVPSDRKLRMEMQPRHLASAVENDEVLIIRGEQLRLPTERTTEAEGIGEAVDDEAYVGVSCMPWALTTHEDRRIPGHLLLNGVLRCLRRPRNTVELNLRQRRFIESIVARTPAGSVSLELPEAVLFPGIFFKTAEDGGVYGALPMCMWSKAYDVEQLGIAGLREHLLTRLQDGALQTSRNEDYITWAFSTLFNTALSRSDSRLVLSRGYYSLTGGQVSVEEGSVLPFDELDSRRAVKQLAASLAASPNVLKVFLTLTCNLSTHFGIAPVTAALREHMENLTKDESTSVWEGALVDLTLGWERAMRYFIEYLQKSEEHILGEIETVFARPGTLERIREAGLAQTWEECCEYLRDYKRTQAHDCKKANSRCIKKRRVVSDEGSTATEEHGFKLIEAPHSNDALKVLERIGLAHRDKPENKPKVCGSLQAGRHTYAADKGNQKIIHDDYQRHCYAADAMTSFQLRPPELHFVDNPIKYHRIFSFVLKKQYRVGGQSISTTEYLVKEELRDTGWVDALNRQVRVRACALEELLQCCMESELSIAEEVHEAIVERILNNNVTDVERERYVDDTEEGQRFAVVVTSNPRPASGNSFLIHLLLSRGRYITELDLFSEGSLREAFKIGKLVPFDEPVREEHVKELMVKYVLQELKYHPTGGTRGFDKAVVDADRMLTQFLLEGDVQYDECPEAIEENLEMNSSVELLRTLGNQRRTVASSVHEQCMPEVPTTEELVQATVEEPLEWVPEIIGSDGSLRETFAEQNGVLQTLMTHIDVHRRQRGSRFVPHVLIEGPPGTGKTFLLKVAIMYMMSRGLQVATTAISSERAVQVGGVHLHQLLQLAVEHSRSGLRPEEAAYRAHAKLARKPLLLAVLRAIDVVAFEEILLLSSELYRTADLILRKIRANDIPWGGLLLIGTGDHKQLPPVRGRMLTVDP